MRTSADKEKFWQARMAELKVLTRYERQVAIALQKFTPPPVKVAARAPVVRRGSLSARMSAVARGAAQEDT